MIPRKGFDVLIKSAKKLSKNYGIYIIGGSPQKEYIEMTNKYGLQNIHFINFLGKDELSDYYLAADLFAFPTREDIWGLVVNEAMAKGLPIITTDKCVAGLELIEDNVNGFIIPTDNSDQLFNKIEVILEHSDLRYKMQKNNLDKISKYTIEKMVDTHLEIFNENLGG